MTTKFLTKIIESADKDRFCFSLSNFLTSLKGKKHSLYFNHDTSFCVLIVYEEVIEKELEKS